MNMWKEIFQEILQPDLRYIYGKTIQYSKCKLEMELISPFGVFKEKEKKIIIEKYLKKEKLLQFLILKELGIIKPEIKIKEIIISKRKSLFGVTLRTKINNWKQGEQFLNIMLQEILKEDEKKRGNIHRIGKNTYEIEDLNFFSKKKYLKKLNENLKKMKIKIILKEKKNSLLSSRIFLNFIGLK